MCRQLFRHDFLCSRWAVTSYRWLIFKILPHEPERSIAHSPATLNWPVRKRSPPRTSPCPREDIWLSTGCNRPHTYTHHTHTHTHTHINLRGRKLTVQLMFACRDLIRFILLWCDPISWCTHTHTHTHTHTLTSSHHSSLSLSICPSLPYLRTVSLSTCLSLLPLATRSR